MCACVTIFLWDLFRYYEGLQRCAGLYSEKGQYSSDEIQQLDALYQSLQQEYTWSSAAKVKRMIIHFPEYLLIGLSSTTQTPRKFYEAFELYSSTAILLEFSWFCWALFLFTSFFPPFGF